MKKSIASKIENCERLECNSGHVNLEFIQHLRQWLKTTSEPTIKDEGNQSNIQDLARL